MFNYFVSEFVWKEFDTGTGRVSTQCLPFLPLCCERLTEFHPDQHVWDQST